jgi:leucyl/phenylalanyl-tRNA--protein transferase
MQDEPSLTLLDPSVDNEPFPPVEMAWEEPNGLLAIGGNLHASRLLNAYRSGVFPWYSDNEPIYWWSPDPRAVLFPHNIRFSRSLRKVIRNKGYTITFDKSFSAVVSACAAPRAYSDGTWITEDMFHAYCELAMQGQAHSVEVWNTNGDLVGGLYGVNANGVFSGESMFSKEPNTSKIALIALAYHLQKWGYALIDCQIESEHLLSMGAEEIKREQYIKILRSTQTPDAVWVVEDELNLSHWKPQIS